jgi:HK97 family phage major capsid protein
MKRTIFPSFHQKSWTEHKAKSNSRLVKIFSVILFAFTFLVLGGTFEPKHSTGMAGTAALAFAPVLFVNRRKNFRATFVNEESEDERKTRVEKEQKEFLGKVTAEFEAILEKKGLNKLKPDEIPTEFKAIKDELEKLSKSTATAELTELKKLVVAQGLEIKALAEKPKDREYKSLKHELTEKLIEKKSVFEQAYADKEFKAGAIKIELKSVVTEMDSTTIGAGSTNYSLTAFTGIISKIRKRITVYLGLVSSGTISAPNAYWIEETTEAGDPIFIGEGDTKTQLSVLYVEKSAPVRKIAVYGKMSWEWMKDLSQLVAYFQNNLLRRLDIATEDQLISGDGMGNNLQGIYLHATPFAAGSLLNTITDANEFDVIIALANQVKKAFGQASAIMVNPDTGAAMRTAKTSLGQPVMGMYGVTNSEELVVNGVRVIETMAIDAGDFVGGDLAVMNVLFADGLTIRIGETGNDLIQNLKTIVLEQRLVQFESANDYKLIVNGTMANAKAQLDKDVSS